MATTNRPPDAPETPAPHTDPVLAQLLEALTDGKKEERKRIDPLILLEVLARRRWHFLLPVLLVAALGIGVVVNTPMIYEATTLILVQPQKVSSEYVRPVVADDLESRLSTISQQINSRSNLERIINDFDLFDGPDARQMFIEDKLNAVRENIRVDLHRLTQRDDPDSFTVSFQGKDPKIVMEIANTLAQNFIDENLRMREAQVFTTDAFIDVQLTEVRGRLQELEQQLKDYRARFMGGLPEQLETNLQMLGRLEVQLVSLQESIRDAKNRLLLINQQMNDLRGFQSQVVPAATGQAAPLDERSQLAMMRQELSEIEGKYTDRHPDVIRLREKISKLESRIAEDKAGGGGGDQTEGLGAAPAYIVQQMTTLMSQRTAALQEIAALEGDIPNVTRRVQDIQSLIDETPRREQELQSLRRDYDNLTASYKSLLDRKHQAEIALNLERAQSGEQFRILDRAQLPTKPAKPNMRKLFILIVGAALAAGGGLVVVTEYFDTSFRSMKNAAETLGLPLLATLPVLEGKQPRRKMVLDMVLTTVSACTAASLFGILALMSINGVDSTLQWFKDLLL
jgi:polysaccharide chain length determinant protein (PEP-CTERM system associated)